MVSKKQDIKLYDPTISLVYANKWTESIFSIQFFDNVRGKRLLFSESFNALNFVPNLRENTSFYFGPLIQIGKTNTPEYDWFHYGGGVTIRYKRVSLTYVYDTKRKLIPEIIRCSNTVKIGIRFGML